MNNPVKKMSMKQMIWAALAITFLAACQRHYYVVRHAEKVSPTSGGQPQPDPPLTERGEAMAQHLKELLLPKKIKHIFSTNTKRTLSTAAPLSQATGIQPQLYGNKPDSAFIRQLKNLKHNTLVVGHSNTVDDIINGLADKTFINGDLQDTDYGGLYVLTVKGKKVYFKRLTY
jgi:phosphohistidine phosphatase SixA